MFSHWMKRAVISVVMLSICVIHTGRASSLDPGTPTLSGAGMVDLGVGANFFEEGETLAVTATPDAGGLFAPWSRSLAGVYGNPAEEVSLPPRTVVLLDIVTQPQGGRKYTGGALTLSVVAEGGLPPYRYTWYKGKTQVGTNPTYVIASLQPTDTGWYSVVVTDAHLDSVQSIPTPLTVGAHVVVSTQPLGADKYVGQSYTFVVGANGGYFPFTYTWKKGLNTVGTGKALLELTNLQQTDTGNYSVFVKDTNTDNMQSNIVPLVVKPRVFFTAHPANATVLPGASHTFTAGVNGGYPPYSYTWYKGAKVVGRDATYTVPAMTSNDQGWYKVLVTDKYGVSRYSAPARLILGTETVIMLPGGVPLVLVHIPAGSFQMGSPDTERNRNSTEEPVHTVNISYDFYMGKYEVTQAQWLAVMNSWPGVAPSARDGLGDNYPAYNISWNDIKSFINALNTHIAATYQGATTMRLPSEAEWEYACRAGTHTRFHFGDSLGVADYCEDDGIRSQYMWYCGNFASFTSKPVGSLLPNNFGLFDMHGNVQEWCEDDLHATYAGAPVNGSAWVDLPRGTLRILRSGYWGGSADQCRSAYRGANVPSFRDLFVGFRLASVR